MAGLKWNVYVGILQADGTTKLVTKVDNATKTAYWNEGTPLKMTFSRAKDLTWALSVNGYNAYVIQSLYEY